MKVRLVQGAFRYGLLRCKGDTKYDRMTSLIKRLWLYVETGNLECLVDAANMAFLEFVEGREPVWTKAQDKLFPLEFPRLRYTQQRVHDYLHIGYKEKMMVYIAKALAAELAHSDHPNKHFKSAPAEGSHHTERII